MADKQIVMHLPDYHDAAHYAPGTDVRLDVEGVTDAGLDAVRVTGRAVLSGRAPMSPRTVGRPISTWTRAWWRHPVVSLPISRVEGYETDPGYRE